MFLDDELIGSQEYLVFFYTTVKSAAFTHLLRENQNLFPLGMVRLLFFYSQKQLDADLTTLEIGFQIFVKHFSAQSRKIKSYYKRLQAFKLFAV